MAEYWSNLFLRFLFWTEKRLSSIKTRKRKIRVMIGFLNCPITANCQVTLRSYNCTDWSVKNEAANAPITFKEIVMVMIGKISFISVIDRLWGQDGWILVEFVFAFSFLDREAVEFHKNTKTENKSNSLIILLAAPVIKMMWILCFDWTTRINLARSRSANAAILNSRLVNFNEAFRLSMNQILIYSLSIIVLEGATEILLPNIILNLLPHH